MASHLGMLKRTDEANARIDAAMAVLAKGSESPARTRQKNLDDVLRLEWLADNLETLAGTAPADDEEPVATDAVTVEANDESDTDDAFARPARKRTNARRGKDGDA